MSRRDGNMPHTMREIKEGEGLKETVFEARTRETETD